MDFVPFSRQDEETLSRLMRQSIAALESEDAISAAQTHLAAWRFVCSLMDGYHRPCVEAVLLIGDYEQVRNWVLMVVQQLDAARQIDRDYGNEVLSFCLEYIRRSDGNDVLLMFLLQMSAAQTCFYLGSPLAGDLEYDRLVGRYPEVSEGWLRWAEAYSLAEDTEENTQKGISILERALKVAELDDREEVLIALLDLYEREDPYCERADEICRELDDLLEAKVKGGHDHGHDHDQQCGCGRHDHDHECGCGHHHDHDHDCACGCSCHDAGRPGRNDLCPCGSGKKYKKCCGANA